MNRSQGMNTYICIGCDKWSDANIHGYHEFEEGLMCDDCESEHHNEEFREMMDQIRKMAKMGEM